MKRGDPAAWDPEYTPGGARDTREVYLLAFNVLASQVPGDTPCTSSLNMEVAQGWKWLDDTTFEIQVRQGIKFQNKPPVNGRDLTAQDVAYSMKRAFTVPRAGLEAVGRAVKDVKAAGPYAVQVTTQTPLPALVGLYMAHMYGSIVLAKETANARERWDAPENYIGSGPFMLDSWTPGVKLTFSRNPNYWKKGLPYVDRIEQLIMPDQSTRMAALRSGKLDVWLGEVPIAITRALSATAPNLKQQKCLSGTGYKIWMRADKPPFSDVRVRRAVSMALDREALVKTVYQGEGQVIPLYPPSTSSLHVGMNDLSPETRKYLSFNPQEAKKLLADAGYPNGLETTFETTKYYGSPWTENMEAVLSMLQQVGIRASPEWLEYGRFQQGPTRGEYKNMAATMWLLDQPLDMLSSYRSTGGPRNRSHLQDPVLDAQVDKLLSSLDEAQQKAAAFQVQQRVIDQAYALSLPALLDNALFQPSIRGLVWSGNFYWTGPYYERVWIEK